MNQADGEINREMPPGETYEAKLEKLQSIVSRLDSSETPISRVAEDVKIGARLIKELEKILKSLRYIS